MTRSIPLAARLPERVRPPLPRQDPGHAMVQRGERLFGALSPKMHTRAAQGLQWGYGLTWPLGLAALSGVLGLRSPGRTIAAGALLGAVVWLVGYEGWLPALGLVPHAHRVPLAKNAAGLASHVAYGTLAALPLALTAPRIEA
jgi:hypothetical protein